MSKPTIETRLTLLEQKVEALQGGRSGRKALPVLVSEEGVCGVEPENKRFGATTNCPYASIYRHQKGCRGTACVLKSSEYYKAYRQEKATAAKRKKRVRRNGQ